MAQPEAAGFWPQMNAFRTDRSLQHTVGSQPIWCARESTAATAVHHIDHIGLLSQEKQQLAWAGGLGWGFYVKKNETLGMDTPSSGRSESFAGGVLKSTGTGTTVCAGGWA